MKTTSKVACALVAGAMALAGCGGGDSGSAEDEAAIEELVTPINQANADRDGAAYCDLLQPSTFFDTFTSRAKCARETNQILDQAGRQPDSQQVTHPAEVELSLVPRPEDLVYARA